MADRKVLFIGLVWPEPRSSAAGWRILQLIELFRGMNYQIHFASTAQKTPYSYDLAKDGVIEQSILLNDASFDDYIKKLNPEMVVFDRFMVEEQFGWRVKEQCPTTIRILDTEDLHFVRRSRELAYKKDVAVDFSNSDDFKREMASIYRSDLSLIISAFEMELLQNEFKLNANQLCYLPLLEKPNETYLPEFEERKDFCFIGNFIHEPNYQTVIMLKKLWPKIRKALPKSELHIYGAYATAKVKQLHQPKDGFLIKDRAEDARETLQHYRLLLAPIPFGAGLKGKFIDAMAVGTPNICSSIGAEGIVHDEWAGTVTDTDEEFIEKSVALYQDKKQWLEKQKIGFNILRTNFDFDHYKNKFEKQIEDLRLNITKFRKQNFVGEILWFENNLATKYLAKWIEEKNKKP